MNILKFTDGLGSEVAFSQQELVLVEHDCTQEGTTYQVRKINGMGNAEEASYISTVKKPVFEELKRKYPSTPLLRINRD